MRAGLRSAPLAFWLAAGSVAWAAGFTVWALTASVYAPGGETILEANEELSVRFALAAPLATTTLACLALHRACHRASSVAWTVGAVLAGLLLAFAVVTGFTIGSFILPGAVALVTAAARTRALEVDAARTPPR